MINKIKALTGILSLTLVLSACSVNLGGSQRSLAEIEANEEIYNKGQGIVLATFEDNNEKILEVETEDDQAQAYYGNDIENFDEITPGDSIRYLYDDTKFIKELNIIKKVDPEEPKDQESFLVKAENVDLEGLNEYDAISFLGNNDIPIDGVSIYTDASSEQGEFYFSGVNRFLIVAFSKNGDYVLLDEEYSNYIPEINVYEKNDDLIISIGEVGSSNIKISNYKYTDQGFEGQIVFEEDKIDLKGSTK